MRLAAMRFLCKLGATTEKRSEKVWPLIDEGIQCYHGDLEFQDMLLAVIDFSQGKLDGSVKSALADRMRFDPRTARACSSAVPTKSSRMLPSSKEIVA